MNIQTKIALITAILIVMVGTSISINHKKSTDTKISTEVTHIIAYAPPRNNSEVSTEEGSCWTNSIAAPYRPDAWRCTVGNAISDPCFKIADSTTLLCNPATTDTDTQTSFVLSLNKPLPTATIPPGTVPTNWGWKIKLADNTICTPFTGTRPFTADHQIAMYGCTDNTVILGDLDTTNATWNATVATLSVIGNGLPTATAVHTVSVDTVWQ